MEFEPTNLPGCFLIRPVVRQDDRGSFVKVFEADRFEALDHEGRIAEVFYSRSVKNVIRGLHFQLPPHDHAKAVHCLEGEVMDVAVDLRKGSPAYGAHCAVRLSGAEGTGLFIPRGLAHGFCVLSDQALLAYRTSTQHAAQSDTGVHWNSAGIDWPVEHPILSLRDSELKPLTEFRSPFTFSPKRIS